MLQHSRVWPGRIAQLARALPSHGRGPQFKSAYAHHPEPLLRQGFRRLGTCATTVELGSMAHAEPLIAVRPPSADVGRTG